MLAPWKKSYDHSKQHNKKQSMAKPLQYCKVISPQLKKKKKKAAETLLNQQRSLSESYGFSSGHIWI